MEKCRKEQLQVGLVSRPEVGAELDNLHELDISAKGLAGPAGKCQVPLGNVR
jgi:hypothetical protein